MSLVAKKSLTSTSQIDPQKYIDDVDSDLSTIFVALRTAPIVSKGIVAPTSTPTQIGSIYVDTVAKKLYFATGIASAADWTIAN